MRNILNAKFTVLFVKLIIVSCIFFTKNIAASSSLGINYANTVQYIDGFVAITVVFIGLQMLGSMIGVPFSKNLIPYQLNLQVVGLFAFSCFILMRMQYQTISYIWGVFSLIPFLIDVLSMILQLVQNQKYKLLNSS